MPLSWQEFSSDGKNGITFCVYCLYSCFVSKLYKVGFLVSLETLLSTSVAKEQPWLHKA